MFIMLERMKPSESEEAGSAGRDNDGDADGRARQLVQMQPAQCPVNTKHSKSFMTKYNFIRCMWSILMKTALLWTILGASLNPANMAWDVN